MLFEVCTNVTKTENRWREVSPFGDFGRLRFYVSQHAATDEAGIRLARDPKMATQDAILAGHGTL